MKVKHWIFVFCLALGTARAETPPVPTVSPKPSEIEQLRAQLAETQRQLSAQIVLSNMLLSERNACYNVVAQAKDPTPMPTAKPKEQ